MNELEKAREEINEADAAIAEAYEKRMRAVGKVAAYKQENGLAVFDPEREKTVIENGCKRIGDPELRPYFSRVLSSMMDVSKDYQKNVLGLEKDVVIRRGILKEADRYLDLSRCTLIVTDTGVPEKYAETLASLCQTPVLVRISEGEASKNVENYLLLLKTMLDNGFDRHDSVVALGGGMVGDLAGFAAATYMRGIDFYNIPTTLLSQIDSSVGGKCAVDFGAYKNTVGAFYPARRVLIDPELLKTLPQRQMANGFAEAIKISAVLDPALFAFLEEKGGQFEDNELDETIRRCVSLKEAVVSADSKEKGLRKVLNFGHTVGHAVEKFSPELYHGECVSIGMIPMCGEKVKGRLFRVLQKYGLPTGTDLPADLLFEAIRHDKKNQGDHITLVLLDEIGQYRFENAKSDEFKVRIEEMGGKKA